MAETVIETPLRENRVIDAINDLPAEFAAGGYFARLALRAMGLAALARIKEAFIVKARGGTDDAGDRWVPLSPETIAYRRAKRLRTRAERKRDAIPSRGLTARQQERWWAHYRRALRVFRGNKASAAKRAWVRLKQEGVVTLYDKYGGASVEILRDTGLLLNSLSPGTNVEEQVFRVEAASVIIGSNRKGAGAHHRGIPGRLPQRRLWPRPSDWPDAWWGDITAVAVTGLLKLLAQLLRK